MCSSLHFYLFKDWLIKYFLLLVQLRFQVMCVLIGTAAFVAARKQKYAGASLFDQRRLGIVDNKKRRSSVHNSSASDNINKSEIEMEEMIPLTDDAVDVV